MISRACLVWSPDQRYSDGDSVGIKFALHVSSEGSLICVVLHPRRFEFYDPQLPIYTSPRFLPPAKIVKSKISDAIVSHGAFLEECTVDNAIVGLRARVDKGATIRVRVSMDFVCM